MTDGTHSLTHSSTSAHGWPMMPCTSSYVFAVRGTPFHSSTCMPAVWWKTGFRGGEKRFRGQSWELLTSKLLCVHFPAADMVWKQWNHFRFSRLYAWTHTQKREIWYYLFLISTYSVISHPNKTHTHTHKGFINDIGKDQCASNFGD